MRFAVFVLFVVSLASANAQTITSVEVTGLKRTKQHIADYALEKFIGRDAATLDAKEVEAAVIDTGVLQPSSVSVEESGEGAAVLKVAVAEKWSIIPMPVAYWGSGSYSFGMFLMDMNFLGLRDMAAVGGMYGNTSWLAMAMYNMTPDRRGIPGFNTSFMYRKSSRTDVNHFNEAFRAYKTRAIRATAGIYYSPVRSTSISFGMSFTDLDVIKAVWRAPNDSQVLGFSPGISIRKGVWDGYLMSEKSASLNYSFNWGLRGDSWSELETQAAFRHPLLPGFLLDIGLSGSWKPGGPAYAEGSLGGIDILPSGFSALHLLGGHIGLEKYIVKIKWGTASLLASWQAAVSQGPLAGSHFDHGPVGGVRFYLSRIAIPAFSFGVAYNMTTNIVQFAFGMGMGM